MTESLFASAKRGSLCGFTVLLLFFTLLFPALSKADEATTAEFFAAHFTQQGRSPHTLWVTGTLREQAETLLGHRFPPLRVRYWREGDTSGWVLDEIGKEMPITIGVIVTDQQIDEVRILKYRESRGGEVRYGFFTDQFKGLTLDGNPAAGQMKLSGSIDGISGATLSVTAVRKIATLALLFHQRAKITATP